MFSIEVNTISSSGSIPCILGDCLVSIKYKFNAHVEMLDPDKELVDQFVVCVDREMSLQEAQDLYIANRSAHWDIIAAQDSCTWRLKSFVCRCEDRQTFWPPSTRWQEAKQAQS